ncbi:hypothetical protein Tco_0723418 [Tanacetum coccineum]
MIKEHDQQPKTKATPKKLVYDDSEEEGLDSSETKGLSGRFSNELSETSGTRDRARSSGNSQRSLSQSKTLSHPRRSERLENRSKSKTREGRIKSRGKRSEHKEVSSDFNCEEKSKDTCEDLSTPYKRLKPTHVTTRITRFKYHRRAKLPRNIRVYEDNKDLEDHLSIFSAVAEQEGWPMPIWCKMFRQTLSGAARNWFDDLDPKSVDNFNELIHMFLEELSQQKWYAKDPTEIHGIKKRLNDGLQAFMDYVRGCLELMLNGLSGVTLPWTTFRSKGGTTIYLVQAHISKVSRDDLVVPSDAIQRLVRQTGTHLLYVIDTICCARGVGEVGHGSVGVGAGRVWQTWEFSKANGIEWPGGQRASIRGYCSRQHVNSDTYSWECSPPTPPYNVDKMFERVRAFIRGEEASGSVEVGRAPQWDRGNARVGWSGGKERIKGRSGPREFRRNMGTCAPYSRRDTFTPLTKTPKEILAMESVNFPPPPPLVGTPKKQNLNKFCDYHRDRGHNTNDFYHLKKQIEDDVALGKLAHLVKDICQGNQRNRGQGRGNRKVINMVGLGGNRKRPYEMEGPRLTEEITFLTVPQNSFADALIILEGTIEGFRGSQEKFITPGVDRPQGNYGEPGRNKTVLMEFAIVKCRSSYNVILRRMEMKSLRAVGSTIHSIIKFPTANRVATMTTSREALWECRMIEEMQSSWKETQWHQHMDHRIREQAILRSQSMAGKRAGKEHMVPE